MRLIFIIVLLLFYFTPIFPQNNIKLKQELRIKKRFIHPKSKYISVSGGFGFLSTKIKDPNNFLNSGSIMGNNSYLPQIMYEHGLKNNWFLEGGYSFYGTGIMYKREVDGSGTSSYSKLANNHNLDIGLGYRVIGPKNFHYLNLHGGLFFGLVDRNYNNLPAELGGGNYNDQHLGIEYSVSNRLLKYNRFNTGIYLGLSTEIRLSNRVRFFIKYTHRFGINPNFIGELELDSYDYSFNDNASYKVSGNGGFVTGGFKVLLNKKSTLNVKDDEVIKSSDIENKYKIIKPWTHSISLSMASNQYFSVFQRPGFPFANQATRGGNTFTLIDGLLINYQYTLPKNFFAEAEFIYHQHYTALKLNSWIREKPSIPIFSSETGSYNFKFGAGYQLLGKNNLRLINFHTGLTLGVVDNPKESGSNYSDAILYTNPQGSEGALFYSYQTKILSKAYLGLYLGVSKDIRITKNLYAVAKYQYQFGNWNKIIETDLDYELYEPNISLQNNVKVYNTASGHTFSIGLRWYFIK